VHESPRRISYLHSRMSVPNAKLVDILLPTTSENGSSDKLQSCHFPSSAFLLLPCTEQPIDLRVVTALCGVELVSLLLGMEKTAVMLLVLVLG